MIRNNPADTIHFFHFYSRNIGSRRCLFRWSRRCSNRSLHGSRHRRSCHRASPSSRRRHRSRRCITGRYCRLRYFRNSPFLLLNIILYIFLAQPAFVSCALYRIKFFFRNIRTSCQLNHHRRIPAFFSLCYLRRYFSCIRRSILLTFWSFFSTCSFFIGCLFTSHIYNSNHCTHSDCISFLKQDFHYLTGYR